MATVYLIGDPGTLQFTNAGSWIVTNVQGWHDQPGAKVSLVERELGNGAYAITDEQVTYSARTVTVDWAYIGADRVQAVDAIERVQSYAGQLVQLRVVDGSADTFSTGYVTVSAQARITGGTVAGSFTFVAPDPRRLSWTPNKVQLTPELGTGGGFSFGSSNNGVVFPISFGPYGSPVNTGILTNAGSATAYPVFKVNGAFDSVELQFGSQTLAYGQPVIAGGTVVLDTYSRTASVDGVDRSSFLLSRGFVPIPPGGSLTCTLKSYGTGWIEAYAHDTYI